MQKLRKASTLIPNVVHDKFAHCILVVAFILFAIPFPALAIEAGIDGPAEYMRLATAHIKYNWEPKGPDNAEGDQIYARLRQIKSASKQ